MNKSLILCAVTFCIINCSASYAINDNDFGVVMEGYEINKTEEPEQDTQKTIIKEMPENEEDAIQLNVNDKNKNKYNIDKVPTLLNSTTPEYNKDTTQNYSPKPGDEYTKKTTSFKKEKKLKHVDVGAKYDTSFTPENVTQTRTLYAKKRFNKNISVDTSYKNNSLGDAEQQMKGTVSVTPEYRFNKHFAVQNSISKNMSNKSTKEEVSIKLNPLKDTERMDFNVGAGQVQYDNGSPSSSQINFGTNFKF